MEPGLATLSNELLCSIAQYLSLKDVLTLSMLCKRLHSGVTMHLRLRKRIDFCEDKVYSYMPSSITDDHIHALLRKCPHLEVVYGLHPQKVERRRLRKRAALTVPGIIEALSLCCNLKTVETNDLRLLEAIMQNLPQIEIINNFHNRGGVFPPSASQRLKLKPYPRLSSLHLTGVEVPELTAMPHLQHIFLQCVRFTKLQPFRGFTAPKLETFVMRHCMGPSISIRYLSLIIALSSAPSLTRLELVRVPLPGGMFQRAVEESYHHNGFVNLKSLVISGCKGVLETDLGYLMIVAYKNLEVLSIQPSLTRDSLFMSLAFSRGRFMKLKTLHLGYVDKLDLSDIEDLSNEFLLSVGFAEVPETPSSLTDSGMKILGALCPNICSLTVSNCPHLMTMEYWLEPLMGHWNYLTDLVLQKCHCLRLNSFAQTLTLLPKIEVVILNDMFREPPKGCNHVGLSAGTGLGMSSAVVSNQDEHLAVQGHQQDLELHAEENLENEEIAGNDPDNLDQHIMVLQQDFFNEENPPRAQALNVNLLPPANPQRHRILPLVVPNAVAGRIRGLPVEDGIEDDAPNIQELPQPPELEENVPPPLENVDINANLQELSNYEESFGDENRKSLNRLNEDFFTRGWIDDEYESKMISTLHTQDMFKKCRNKCSVNFDPNQPSTSRSGNCTDSFCINYKFECKNSATPKYSIVNHVPASLNYSNTCKFQSIIEARKYYEATKHQKNSNPVQESSDIKIITTPNKTLKPNEYFCNISIKSEPVSSEDETNNFESSPKKTKLLGNGNISYEQMEKNECSFDVFVAKTEPLDVREEEISTSNKDEQFNEMSNSVKIEPEECSLPSFNQQEILIGPEKSNNILNKVENNSTHLASTSQKYKTKSSSRKIESIILEKGSVSNNTCTKCNSNSFIHTNTQNLNTKSNKRTQYSKTEIAKKTKNIQSSKHGVSHLKLKEKQPTKTKCVKETPILGEKINTRSSRNKKVSHIKCPFANTKCEMHRVEPTKQTPSVSSLPSSSRDQTLHKNDGVKTATALMDQNQTNYKTERPTLRHTSDISTSSNQEQISNKRTKKKRTASSISGAPSQKIQKTNNTQPTDQNLSSSSVTKCSSVPPAYIYNKTSENMPSTSMTLPSTSVDHNSKDAGNGKKKRKKSKLKCKNCRFTRKYGPRKHYITRYWRKKYFKERDKVVSQGTQASSVDIRRSLRRPITPQRYKPKKKISLDPPAKPKYRVISCKETACRLKKEAKEKVVMLNKGTSTSDPLLEEDAVQVLIIVSKTLISLTIRSCGISGIVLERCPQLTHFEVQTCRIFKSFHVNYCLHLCRLGFLQCPKITIASFINEAFRKTFDNILLVNYEPCMQNFSFGETESAILRCTPLEQSVVIFFDMDSGDENRRAVTKENLFMWMQVMRCKYARLAYSCWPEYSMSEKSRKFPYIQFSRRIHGVYTDLNGKQMKYQIVTNDPVFFKILEREPWTNGFQAPPPKINLRPLGGRDPYSSSNSAKMLRFKWLHKIVTFYVPLSEKDLI